jgi:hypothetical protein
LAITDGETSAESGSGLNRRCRWLTAMAKAPADVEAIDP